MARRELTMEEAGSIVLPFGKFKDKSIDEVASTDDGLKYLDWLLGQAWLRGDMKLGIEVYLSDEAVSRDLQDALGDD